jgi:hypothetical protein
VTVTGHSEHLYGFEHRSPGAVLELLKLLLLGPASLLVRADQRTQPPQPESCSWTEIRATSRSTKRTKGAQSGPTASLR